MKRLESAAINEQWDVPLTAHRGLGERPFELSPRRGGSAQTSRRLHFRDVRLRDGSQGPDVDFRKAGNVHPTRLLDKAGVDRIEVPMPPISKEMLKGSSPSQISAGARADAILPAHRDIDVAADNWRRRVVVAVPAGVPRLQIPVSRGRPTTWSKRASPASRTESSTRRCLLPIGPERSRPRLRRSTSLPCLRPATT